MLLIFSHSKLCTRSHLCVYVFKSLESCPTLCDPMDCSPPGFSVHGILQPRILEWVAMPSSRGSSCPGIEPASVVSCIGRQVLYHKCHLGGGCVCVRAHMRARPLGSAVCVCVRSPCACVQVWVCVCEREREREECLPGFGVPSPCPPLILSSREALRQRCS